MSKALDLTNQKFGKLIALERAPKRNDKYTRWICQCDCGKKIEVRTDYLRNGHTTSCGCKKEKYFKNLDLVNQKFGKLKVLENLSGGKKKCKCDCGNIVIVETSNLTSGNTQSCGCLQKERTSETNLKNLIGKRFGKLTVIKRAANNRFGHVCWECQCDCGGVTIVDANNLRNGTVNSCGCLKSKGEMLINNWLQKHKINFIPQYSHTEIVLESGRRPFFDFAIFNSDNSIKCFIEYNGKQHYQITGGWNTEEQFKNTQNRDNQKRAWCEKLNIPLYIIKYDENIENALENIFKAEATEPDMEEAQDVDG